MEYLELGDLKRHMSRNPQNILIKALPPEVWWVKLADFGLSKRMEEQSTPSNLIGTWGFVEPEFHGLVTKFNSTRLFEKT
jgi:serine/threonine protein kinase